MSSIFGKKKNRKAVNIDDDILKINVYFDKHGLISYHGHIDRSTAETRLLAEWKKTRKEENHIGLYLIRDSNGHAGDYVLSYTVLEDVGGSKLLTCKHLNILQVHVYGELVSSYAIGQNNFFGLDAVLVWGKKNGIIKKPLKVGNSFSANLPPYTIGAATSTLLHEAIQSENENLVDTILKSSKFIESDLAILRDADGESALHLACELGLLSIVKKLVDVNIIITLRNKLGYTPLHVAVKFKRLQIAEYLLTQGADAFDRCLKEPYNSCLHDAAANGSKEIIALLLNNSAPPWAFNIRSEIPSEIAEKSGHIECGKFIENIQLPNANTNRNDWFHESLTREKCEELFTKHDFEDGLFVVRSSSQPGYLSLSLCFMDKAQHFRMRAIENQLYRIEPQGTTWPTLEHLIEHYSTRIDILPCRLTTAISPINFKLVTLSCPMPKLRMVIAQKSINSDKIGGSYLETVIDTRKPSYLKDSNETVDTDYEMVTVKKPLEIDRKLIKMGHPLGNGEFGIVYNGNLIQDGNIKVDVAIKTLSSVSSGDAITQFLREANIMVNLDHPNIIKLIGICRVPDQIMMVEELAKLGSLLDFMMDYADKINPKKDLNIWAHHIACGMSYLEDRRFVHRDLAARNVLLTANKIAKVGDFGLSRAMNTEGEIYQSEEGGKWPIKWYALEAILYGTFSSASDVWSYGVTLWEMFTFGQQPYGDLKGNALVTEIEAGNRLPKPDTCPDETFQLMLKCWSVRVDERPTFKQLLQYFDSTNAVKTMKRKMKSV